jgi:pyruvate dehydrogenase E1 component beta subunit
MPYTAKDARDLMISSVLSEDPVMFIDDRWLYEKEEEYTEIEIVDLNNVKPQKLRDGNDVTVVGLSYTSLLCEKACQSIEISHKITCDFFDIRVLNPLKIDDILESVKKTGRLVVVDGDWESCGMASEIITSVLEKIDVKILKNSPRRITLPNAPAPTSKALEQQYYIKESGIIDMLIQITI